MHGNRVVQHLGIDEIQDRLSPSCPRRGIPQAASKLFMMEFLVRLKDTVGANTVICFNIIIRKSIDKLKVLSRNCSYIDYAD